MNQLAFVVFLFSLSSAFSTDLANPECTALMLTHAAAIEQLAAHIQEHQAIALDADKSALAAALADEIRNEQEALLALGIDGPRLEGAIRQRIQSNIERPKAEPTTAATEQPEKEIAEKLEALAVEPFGAEWFKILRSSASDPETFKHLYNLRDKRAPYSSEMLNVLSYAVAKADYVEKESRENVVKAVDILASHRDSGLLTEAHVFSIIQALCGVTKAYEREDAQRISNSLLEIIQVQGISSKNIKHLVHSYSESNLRRHHYILEVPYSHTRPMWTEDTNQGGFDHRLFLLGELIKLGLLPIEHVGQVITAIDRRPPERQLQQLSQLLIDVKSYGKSGVHSLPSDIFMTFFTRFTVTPWPTPGSRFDVSRFGVGRDFFDLLATVPLNKHEIDQIFQIQMHYIDVESFIKARTPSPALLEDYVLYSLGAGKTVPPTYWDLRKFRQSRSWSPPMLTAIESLEAKHVKPRYKAAADKFMRIHDWFFGPWTPPGGRP